MAVDYNIDFEKLRSEIKKNNAHKVLLQLPEGLKIYAVGWAEKLRSPGVEVIISSDPCWGACDLRAPEWADLVIHFGHSKKIDSKKVKQMLGVESLRFATPEEVTELTGCVPGGVPPFANIFGLDLIVDKTIPMNEFMAFNAGERTKSLKLRTEDYLKLLTPRIEDFSV